MTDAAIGRVALWYSPSFTKARIDTHTVNFKDGRSLTCLHLQSKGESMDFSSYPSDLRILCEVKWSEIDDVVIDTSPRRSFMPLVPKVA